MTVVGQRPRFAPHPQAVTVIGRDDIVRTGAESLADLLTRQAFAVRRYGAAGAVASVSLRGASGEGVLVLRDGVRLNNPQNGAVDLSTISLLGIDRVEVLEGGSSGLFGPDAVGGVINLISSNRPVTRLEVGAGLWGTGHIRFETGQAQEDGQTAVGVSRSFAQNDYGYTYRNTAEIRRNARLDSTDVSVRMKRFLGTDVVDASVGYTNQAKGVPGPVNFPSLRASQTDDNLTGTFKWTRVVPGGPVPTLSLSHNHLQNDFLDLDTTFGPPHTRNGVDSTDLRGKLAATVASHDVEVGAGLLRDALDNSGFGFQQRYTGSVFARDTMRPQPGLDVFADGRVDVSSLSGAGLSPRSGLAWTLGDALRVRAAFGQSYRQPTFNDLFWPTSQFAAGNPNLRHETTRTYEAGVDLAPASAIRLGLTGYLNLGSGTIVWQPGSGGRWSPVNLGATDARGFEAKGTIQVAEGLAFSASHAQQSATDRAVTGATAGKELPFRPDSISALSARLGPWNGLGLTVGFEAVGRRFATAANTETLSPYQLLSADLEWAVTRSDTARLHGDNLLNTYYVLQPQFPMPGRALTASWAHTF